MIPSVEIAGARVFLGDCRDVLKTLPDNSVDSVVTDPPYELGFMGKKWDNSGIAYDVTVWLECLRVLKPGGHVLAFGGSRTWHRLAVAIEDAGFDLRDSIAWIYGSGFPKSLDVSKAVDKKLGAEREKIRTRVTPRTTAGKGATNNDLDSRPWLEKARAQGFHEHDGNDASSPEAQQWQGWGTALKPAFEPVVVGRKPLVGTVAENVLAWGVGGLNIDGSRIGTGTGESRTVSYPDIRGDNYQQGKEAYSERGTVERVVKDQGRWPANVVLDEVSAGLLDEQSGKIVDRNGGRGGWRETYVGAKAIADCNTPTYRGEGGASRFFYVAKASKRDRNEGLEDLGENDSIKWSGGNKGQGVGAFYPDGTARPPQKSHNFHPTVKPTQLMRYLIKLVTPEGGTVLDPFTGSGSTGKAALLDGYEFIGAELTEEYLPIIEGRLRWALEQEGEDDDTLF